MVVPILASHLPPASSVWEDFLLVDRDPRGVRHRVHPGAPAVGRSYYWASRKQCGGRETANRSRSRHSLAGEAAAGYIETSLAVVGSYQEHGSPGQLRLHPQVESCGLVVVMDCCQRSDGSLPLDRRPAELASTLFFWRMRRQEVMLWLGQSASGTFLLTRS